VTGAVETSIDIASGYVRMSQDVGYWRVYRSPTGASNFIFVSFDLPLRLAPRGLI